MYNFVALDWLLHTTSLLLMEHNIMCCAIKIGYIDCTALPYSSIPMQYRFIYFYVYENNATISWSMWHVVAICDHDHI